MKGKMKIKSASLSPSEFTYKQAFELDHFLEWLTFFSLGSIWK